jgi:NTP pyrophosphatase (non-canonical NTP hydrolase)
VADTKFPTSLSLERTPEGTRLAYVAGDRVIVPGHPDSDDESHSCDEMGCGHEHVVARYVALAADDAASLQEAARGRDARQRAVHEWCIAAFGEAHASSIPQRALRLLEEAIELFQAAGGSSDMAHRLIDFIFFRPPGQLGQEIGGLGVTVLALAAAAGLSADGEEARELARATAKPLEHFRERNEQKNAAGFDVLAPRPPAGGR